MPITKQASMVARRTKMSMASPQNVFLRMILSENRSPLFGIARRLLERRDGMFGTRRLRRRPDREPFEYEQQQDRAADRDRQVSHTDRQRRKIGDRILPGCGDELDAPVDHEQRDQGHQAFDEEREGAPQQLRQQRDKKP